MQRVRYVDSHTGGEPTRLVLDGFPDLTHLPLRERVAALRTQHDRYRAALVTEPRASDVVVGAVLMPPVEKGSIASVIYFNNAGYLGMCGTARSASSRRCSIWARSAKAHITSIRPWER